MSKPKFALLDAAKFTELLKSVAKRQKLLDSDIQKLAVSAIGYSIIHGDVQPANRLFEAMSKSTRRQSMISFFEQHGQLAWMSTDKKFAHFKRDGITFDGDALMGQPWYEAKKETLISSYDVAEGVEAFLKRMNKLAADGAVELKNRELIGLLQGAVASFHSAEHLSHAEGK